MVERVLPSVVNVRTTSFGGGSGEGSGVVLDRSGIIVTNNHVVEGTTRVNVAFNEAGRPRTLRGEVIGVAPERDLAVIRVDASDLVPIRIGKSSTLRLGDGVVAIGFPLGLGGPTVTQGIVSGLDRTVEPDGAPRLRGLLQTDAAINPGNSGGPLVDLSGRLVGINTAVARLMDAENIGFAISIEEALPVIARIRRPAAARAWFGVAVGSVESDAAAVRLGLDPSVRGVVVSAVYDGQPAAKAGIVVGDVIVGVDGVPVPSAAAFAERLDGLDPGDRVELELVDSAGPRLVTVTLVKRPARLPG
jgi:S1-C subfamily serine protease